MHTQVLTFMFFWMGRKKTPTRFLGGSKPKMKWSFELLGILKKAP
jgi:hypothetical protein